MAPDLLNKKLECWGINSFAVNEETLTFQIGILSEN